jgi:predicted nucleotide-binding protein
MYYQVLIETNERVGKSNTNRQFFELDKTNLLEIEEDIIIPYLQKKEFQFDGYFLKPSDIARVVVKQSERTTKEYSKIENQNMSPGIIMYISPQDTVDYDKYMTDITKQLFKTAKDKIDSGKTESKTIKPKDKPDMTKVFIVHGQDETTKLDVARFVEKLGFEAIILHEQVSSGKTIIEKIEEFSNVGYGVVLYTPCDLGAKKGDEKNLQARARQNVVFEHGYLIAKLGRRNVCALVKGKIEIPNDISGVVYVPLDDHKAWKLELAKELRNAGYNVDMNLII